MIYVNRRSQGLVDMLIAQDHGVRVEISDGTTGDANDAYVVIVDGTKFSEIDPDPNTDQSSTIATNLAAKIDASVLPVSASATGSEVEILPDTSGTKISVETATTDDAGSIFTRTFTPESYVVKQADNWDGAFAAMETVRRNTGKRSASMRTPAARMRHALNANQIGDRVRFLFNPLDYSLDDEDLLFLKVAPVVGGVEQAERPIDIILPPSASVDARPAVVLSGTVPQGATMDDGITFTLPLQSADVEIANTGANPVKVQFGSGPGEYTVEAGGKFSDNRLNVSQISLRGDGGTSAIEMYVVLTPDTSL